MTDPARYYDLHAVASAFGEALIERVPRPFFMAEERHEKVLIAFAFNTVDELAADLGVRHLTAEEAWQVVRVRLAQKAMADSVYLPDDADGIVAEMVERLEGGALERLAPLPEGASDELRREHAELEAERDALLGLGIPVHDDLTIEEIEVKSATSDARTFDAPSVGKALAAALMHNRTFPVTIPPWENESAAADLAFQVARDIFAGLPGRDPMRPLTAEEVHRYVNVALRIRNDRRVPDTVDTHDFGLDAARRLDPGYSARPNVRFPDGATFQGPVEEALRVEMGEVHARREKRETTFEGLRRHLRRLL